MSVKLNRQNIKSFSQGEFDSYWIKRPSGCWEWTGTLNRWGYGVWKQGTMAHRFSYVFYVGEIPEGLDIDHQCRNPSCVNYEHLEPITKVENSKRAHERTHKDDGYWGMSGQRLHYLRGQARALRGIGLPDSYIARRLGITKRQVVKVREG